MNKKEFTRRRFIATVSAGSAGVVASGPAFPIINRTNSVSDKLAVLGGEPVRTKEWLSWPLAGVNQNLINEVLNTVKSGNWLRYNGDRVVTFEKEWAGLIGRKESICVNSGTSALNTAVEALDIGPGDEVITSPYSDIGTIMAIAVSRALPVMADLDPESYQLDTDDVERRITSNTKAIMPVHIMGVSCDMDRIMAIARKYNLKVIEDACQAHLAEFQGKKLGSIGDLGCFSFQASKALASGEGGAVTGDDPELMNMAWAYKEKGYARHIKAPDNAIRIGPKYRMHECEGALLMGQLPGLEERFEIRNRNADYLTSQLKDIPGFIPQKKYPGTGRSTYWRYAVSYHKEHFNDASLDDVSRAIRAEGVPFTPYIRNGFHKQGPWNEYMMNKKDFRRSFSKATLKRYREEYEYPNCDRVCNEVLAMYGMGVLLGSREDMDDIVKAVIKVYENRDQLKSL
jgi:dTDP-4-amino-4,6-dideoxygalactose transaminase